MHPAIRHYSIPPKAGLRRTLQRPVRYSTNVVIQSTSENKQSLFETCGRSNEGLRSTPVILFGILFVTLK